MPDTPFGWIATVLVAVVVYKVLRYAVLRRVKGRLREGALRFVRQHQVPLESARFIDRLWLREALLQDAEVDRVVVSAASPGTEPLVAIRHRVETYVDETVPAFSITVYYRLGALLAKLAVGFLYELVFDRRSYERAMARVPAGAVTVFVMNHRSNADYVVLSDGLLRHVALSYAVGEWARVWPLDLLFRSFGSYFVRRGDKDRLYHKVLERFVQLLVSHGGVTGFFIEGRLSRDGLLGAPKTGLLDYVVGVRREHPDQEIAFVPVGVNYDRVFEDRALSSEGGAPPTVADKLASLLRLLALLPWLVGANLVRVATRSHRKLGYAAVEVGEPLLWSELQGAQELARLPRPERRARLDGVARRLVEAIGQTVPATPVPVFCLSLLAGEDLERGQVTSRVRDTLASLRAAGAPLALGQAFSGNLSAAGQPMGDLDEEVTALVEAEMVVALAGFALERRQLVEHRAGRFVVPAEARPILRYYANSVVHHLASTG